LKIAADKIVLPRDRTTIRIRDRYERVVFEVALRGGAVFLSREKLEDVLTPPRDLQSGKIEAVK